MGATCWFLLSKLLNLPPLLSAFSVDDSLQFKLSPYIIPCWTIHHRNCAYISIYIATLRNVILFTIFEKKTITLFLHRLYGLPVARSSCCGSIRAEQDTSINCSEVPRNTRTYFARLQKKYVLISRCLL